MKISKWEKIMLGLTAAFLLVTAGYFWGAQGGAEPYRVEVEYQREAPAPAAAPAPGPSQTPADKLNINTATAQALEALPGIGEKRAADIVADREANGPFRIPEDLTRVKGIGEGTLEGLLDFITAE